MGKNDLIFPDIFELILTIKNGSNNTGCIKILPLPYNFRTSSIIERAQGHVYVINVNTVIVCELQSFTPNPKTGIGRNKCKKNRNYKPPSSSF